MSGPAQTNLVVTGPGQGEFQRDIPFNSNSDSERSTILNSRQIKQCYIGTSASCSNKFSNFIREEHERGRYTWKYRNRSLERVP